MDNCYFETAISYWFFIASKKQHNTYQTYIDATKNGSTGIVASPGYPGNYAYNANYTWTLNKGNLKTTISFSFSEFNIKKFHYTCCEGYLQVSTLDKKHLNFSYIYVRTSNKLNLYFDGSSITLYGVFIHMIIKWTEL